MRVPADVAEDLVRTGKRRLGEDHPFRRPHAGQMLQERGAFLQGQQGGEKAQSASGERLVQVVQKQPAEQARQNFDR